MTKATGGNIHANSSAGSLGPGALILLAAGLTACDGATSRVGAAPDWANGYVRPFGPDAPWNIPVAGLPRHPDSVLYSDLLWNDAPDRPGNFNLTFERYTYPVYDAAEADGWYELRTDWETRIDGMRMPWHPDWRPAPGSDAQAIVLEPDEGVEWDLFQVSFDGTRVRATNGSVVDDYRTLEEGQQRSRGAGIPYLAMLVRPQEVALGRIEHALSMPIINTDGDFFVAPATKLEFPDHPPGIPEGMRFALDVTDAEIDAWIAALPRRLPPGTRRSARILAEALRDYGWFITDTSGGAHLQFEANVTAGDRWAELGLGDYRAGGSSYPRDLLDGLITRDRIYAIVPSDQY